MPKIAQPKVVQTDGTTNEANGDRDNREEVWQGALMEAVQAWVASRAQYRDGKLAVGRLLRTYLAARLRVADSLAYGKRGAAAASRSRAIREAARALGIRVAMVNAMIRAAVVVELLADDGGVGALSWSTIHRFAKLVERPYGPTDRARAGGSIGNGLRPSEKEIWLVAHPQQYNIDLFRRAVRENWDDARARDQLRSVVQPTAKARQAKEALAVERRPERETTDLTTLGNAVAASSPRDAAELLMGVLRQASDPVAVGECLLRLVKSATLMRLSG